MSASTPPERLRFYNTQIFLIAFSLLGFGVAFFFLRILTSGGGISHVWDRQWHVSCASTKQRHPASVVLPGSITCSFCSTAQRCSRGSHDSCPREPVRTGATLTELMEEPVDPITPSSEKPRTQEAAVCPTSLAQLRTEEL